MAPELTLYEGPPFAESPIWRVGDYGDNLKQVTHSATGASLWCHRKSVGWAVIDDKGKHVAGGINLLDAVERAKQYIEALVR